MARHAETTFHKRLVLISQCPMISYSSKDNVQEICGQFRFSADFLNIFLGRL